MKISTILVTFLLCVIMGTFAQQTVDTVAGLFLYKVVDNGDLQYVLLQKVRIQKLLKITVVD